MDEKEKMKGGEEITQQEIISIFSNLHDGTIESYSESISGLKLKVSCLYLAELIDRSFEYFFIEMTGITKLDFDLWVNAGNGQKKLTEPDEIFKTELEILSAEAKEDFVAIACKADKGLGYSGGNLNLRCDKIEVFDQINRRMNMEQLNELSRSYWKR